MSDFEAGGTSNIVGQPLEALGSIPDADRLRHYPFYSAALGELELRRGNLDAAHEQFASAVALARNPAERRFLARRRSECLRPRRSVAREDDKNVHEIS